MNRALSRGCLVKCLVLAQTGSNERGAWRDAECQTVRINSPPPLSSTDGAASIFRLFYHANVLKMTGGVGAKIEEGVSSGLVCHTNVEECELGQFSVGTWPIYPPSPAPGGTSLSALVSPLPSLQKLLDASNVASHCCCHCVTAELFRLFPRKLHFSRD